MCLAAQRPALFFLEARVVAGDAQFHRVGVSVGLTFLLRRENSYYAPPREGRGQETVWIDRPRVVSDWRERRHEIPAHQRERGGVVELHHPTFSLRRTSSQHGWRRASPELRDNCQPNDNRNQKHQNYETLKRIYPTLIETHRQSAYDDNE